MTVKQNERNRINQSRGYSIKEIQRSNDLYLAKVETLAVRCGYNSLVDEIVRLRGRM